MGQFSTPIMPSDGSLLHADSQGEHPKVVCERLGHSTIATTMDIYSHVIPSMQRDAARKLDAAFETEKETDEARHR